MVVEAFVIAGRVPTRVVVVVVNVAVVVADMTTWGFTPRSSDDGVNYTEVQAGNGRRSKGGLYRGVSWFREEKGSALMKHLHEGGSLTPYCATRFCAANGWFVSRVQFFAVLFFLFHPSRTYWNRLLQTFLSFVFLAGVPKMSPPPRGIDC